MEIITPREKIRKFFEKHLEFLTSVPQQRLQEMILSSFIKGHSGKIVDYGECGPTHRTTYGHFLDRGKWDDKRLEETQKTREPPDGFGTFPPRWNTSFYQHRRHSPV